MDSNVERRDVSGRVILDNKVEKSEVSGKTKPSASTAKSIVINQPCGKG